MPQKSHLPRTFRGKISEPPRNAEMLAPVTFSKTRGKIRSPLRANLRLYAGAHELTRPARTIAARGLLHLLAFALLGTGFAAEQATNISTNQTLPQDTALKKLSLEELMSLEVTSVTRKAEPWFTSASAIQVITGEEINRSAASSLPEALRLAPNLQVAQIDSRQWAISARGFNNGLANKLLVMMDGRTLYTPLFAGVFWDVQDTMLEDLDRIEVISGPGASLWGANAVNGVINIISKPANETQGVLATAGGGTFLQDFASARYGGKIGENLYFRVYGKYFDRDESLLPSGAEGTNAWRFGQSGFRLDYLPRSGDIVTVQGDGYGGAFDQTGADAGQVNGQNVVARWSHPTGPDSDLTLQAYWDRTYRHQINFQDELNTYDVDFQHHFSLFQRVLAVTWGAEYRAMLDRVANTPALAFIPPNRNLELFSSFLQGEVTVVPDRLRLTLGTKLEHNDYSGFEVEPSARISYTPTENQTWWFAASRAVRAPSRIDEDLELPGVPPFVIVPGGDFKSESVIALEPGYRVRLFKRFTLSIAGFYNFYDNIRSLEPIATNVFVIRNGNRGESGGVELSGTWQATDWWRLRGGYTYVAKNIFIKPGESDLNQGRAEGNDPNNQFLLQSILDLPCNVQLDTTFRYVDRLPSPHVPAYATMDVRLAWRPRRNLELSIVGQNLFDKQHPEFGSPATRQEIPRSVYGKVTWKF